MTLIAQISDLHLVPRGTLCCGRVDTNAHAERAVEAVRRLIPRPDAVIVTGDVIETMREDEYAIAREIFERLDMPFYLLSGNHDNSAALKRVFRDYDFASSGLPDRLYYAADIGTIRLIILDSSVPGASHGALATEQLVFLDQELAAAKDRPALIAMHHPPIATGHRIMDSIGLRDRSKLAEVVGRHRNVVRLLCGHFHRAVVSAFAGTIVTIAPSTAHQLELALDGDDDLAFNLEPPAFLLHRWGEREDMATHQVMVDRFPGPYPFV